MKAGIRVAVDMVEHVASDRGVSRTVAVEVDSVAMRWGGGGRATAATLRTEKEMAGGPAVRVGLVRYCRTGLSPRPN
jgi:nanoRNase/pAp phosphatase (c-di-AMP/oligoRNAs hydrolase)